MIGTNLAITTKNYAVAGGVTYDADALAYFTANTAITSAADKNAINTFYLGLKSDGIYTDIKAMYLPIWLNSANSKWNLINNRTYDLSFSTGWNFANTGMKGNGTSTFANTSIIPQTVFTNANISLHVYSRTQIIQSSVNRLEFGSFDGTNFVGSSQQYDSYGKITTLGVNNGSYTLIVPSTIVSCNTLGLMSSNRLNNTMKIFQNGTQQATRTVTNSSLSTVNLNIGGYRSGTSTADISTREMPFIAVSNGLTDTQLSNIYTRVQALMTYFGINV